MHRIQALEKKRAEVVEQMKALAAKATDGTALTDEDQKAFDGLRAQVGDIDRQKDNVRSLIELDRSNASARIAEQTRTGNAPGVMSAQITVGEPGWKKDPMRGFKTPREFLCAVIDAGKRGFAQDERLRFLATAGSDEQGGYSDSYGGFLVPEGMSPTLLQMSVEADPIGGRTTKVPLSSPSVSFNARVDKDHSTSVSGGLTVTRRAETQTQGSTRVQFEQVKLEATSLFGLAYASEEILTDSPISFAALLQAGFSDQFTSHLINERINGTGVGEFMGILKSPCLVTVAKETGQAADTIVYENAIKMRARCWRYGNAVWLYNQDALPQLMSMYQAIGTSGVPVWQTSAREGEPDLLLGRPAIPTEYCSTVGNVGDLILGVWSEYLEGTYEPLQSAESIHVRFVNHERTFKFWTRNAGAPWWKSAMTPKNSTATLSPFVVLAAR